MFAVIEISGSVMDLSEIRRAAFVILGSGGHGRAGSRPPMAEAVENNALPTVDVLR